MWTQASTLLLLLFACSFWAADAQGDRKQNIWNDPITFNTKLKDKCTMIITGQGEFTKLKLSCQGPKRSYWCEYVGKPYTCRSFSKNPRHYFVQMMWGFRKLNNACEAPRAIKPHMCRKASDESQMVFSSASLPVHKAATQARVQQRPAPTRPGWSRPVQRQPVRGPVREMQRSGPQPAMPTVETHRKRMARLYCWKSLQGVCAYVIGLNPFLSSCRFSPDSMAFLTNATILLILACISHQLVLSSCQRTNGRKSPRMSRQTKSLQPIKGKMVTKDKAECTWAAAGDNLFTMGVTFA